MGKALNFVFIVACSFPYGDASSIRAQNICRMLHAAGHHVHVIADYVSSEFQESVPYCTYETLFEKQQSLLKRYLVPKASIAVLKEYCANNVVDVIISNARFDRYNALVYFCKECDYKLIIENCEWYHYSSFKLKLLDYRYWKNERMLRAGFAKADGFVSISRLLDEHNKSFGRPSVRIPTIIDVLNARCNLSCSNSKNMIIYAGSLGNSKEFLAPAIKILAENLDFQNKIQFHIYGPNRQKVLANIGGDEQLLYKAGDSVVIHGRVPQKEIHEIMMKADFQLFIRPLRRSSDAGFPTKLGESMTAGTPVITNNTGDIGLYLKDGYNGYLLKDNSPSSVLEAFEKIVSLTKKEREAMRRHARQTAEENFDFRNYIESTQHFINQF